MQENKTNNVLTGFVSVTFRENDNLNSLCSRLADTMPIVLKPWHSAFSPAMKR
jgi:hypothetical protein